jgi:ribonuclease D
MEAYARNDTHYLKPLADKLEAGLREKKRLTWHQESCARLIEDCSQPAPVNEDSIWRVKGSSFLDSAALAVLRELWRWREKEAMAASRPPFFVLAHETMVAISAAVAENRPVDQLIPARMHPRRRENLLAAIHVAQSLSPQKYPQVIRHVAQRPTEAEFRRFRELEKHRNQHAHELQIDPTLIASKATLGDLSRDWEKHAPALMNWQRELLK